MLASTVPNDHKSSIVGLLMVSLLLIAVPILQIARWHESPWRLVVIVVVYLWIICGLILLLSPWYFRKMYEPFLENEARFKIAAYGKTALSVLLLLLGIFVY